MLSTWGGVHFEFSFSDNYWDALTKLEGRNVYYSDGNYADIWQDAAGAWKIDGDIDGIPMQVWIWYSKLSGLYYTFAFDDLTLTLGDTNDYWEIHPCAIYAVDREEFLEVLIKVINTGE